MHGEGGGRSLSAGVGWRGWERGEAGGVVTREPGTSIPLDSGPSPHCPSRPAASLHWRAAIASQAVSNISRKHIFALG